MSVFLGLACSIRLEKDHVESAAGNGESTKALSHIFTTGSALVVASQVHPYINMQLPLGRQILSMSTR